MAESYSVEAVLSAVDKNFSSTMRSGISNMDSLSKATETATSTIGKIAAGIGVFKAVSAAVDLVKSSVSGAVSRIDTLNNANRTFENMGFSANDTAKMMDGLQSSIKGLPTPLDQAVSGVELLAASTNDIGKSQKIWSAMNDGIIGFGGSTAQVQSAVVQLSQAFSNGKVDAATWNSMINDGLGPALNAIARQMGTTTGALKAGLSDGSISVGTFQDALINLDQNGGGGLKSLAQIAKDSTSGISTSIANAKTATTRGVADIIKAIDQGLAANHLPTIGAAISAFGSLVENTLGKVAKVIPPVISKITSFGQAFIPWNGILKAAGAAIAILVTAIMGASKIVAVQAMFTNLKKSIQEITFNPVMLGVAAVVALAAILAKAYQQSAQLRNAVTLIGNAFDSVFGPAISSAKAGISNFLKSFTGMDSISASINSIATLIGDKLATVLLSVNWTAFFSAAKTALMGVVGFIKNVISFVSNMASKISSATGVSKGAIAGIVAAVAGLAGVFALASGGPIKLVASMLGLGKGTKNASGAMTGLSKVLGASGSLVATAGSGFKSLSSIIGGGVISSLSKVRSGLGTLAGPLTSFISKSKLGSTVMTGLGGSGRLLATAFSAISGPVGLLIGALTLVTAGVALTGGSFDAVIGKISAFSNAFVVAAPSIGTAFGQIIQGILTAIATAIPGVMAGIVTLLTTITLAIVTYAPIIAADMTLALVAMITAITAQIPMIAMAATQMIIAFIMAITMAIPQIVPAALQMIATFINTLAVNIGQVIDAGANLIINFLLGVANNMQQIVAAGLQLITQFLLGVAQNISGVVKAGMDVIINVLNGIASRIGDLVTAGVNVIVKFLNGVANNMGRVITAGVNVIVKFLNGIANNIGKVVTAGVNLVLKLSEAIRQRAPQMGQAGANLIIALVKALAAGVAQLARAGLNLAKSAINAVKNKAGDMISAGANFVKGFVKGITGAIGGAVRAAANMAKSALNAAKSALGIHSPSRVMKKEVGYYTAAGMAVGILDNLKLVTDAAKQLAGAAVPTVPSFDFEASYDASNLDNFMAGTKKLQSNLQAAVSSQVNFSEQKQFTVEVPVNLDGKEVARITAEPMESELAKRSQRSDRIYGKRN